ncbi:hypothetical protein B0H17DRAFT_1102987 [Mycena rosella]|uniref:Uncharacterized protein n=1 Tax=Mycena rosella TaxID=1033263 RepID=A0AAD7CH60_MYCRO|nr:hypothetical protein B0H17DRAFT_1102987 [Mycena rosella]
MFQNLLLLLAPIVALVAAAPIGGLAARTTSIATTGGSPCAPSPVFLSVVKLTSSEPPVASATANALVTRPAITPALGQSSVPPHPTVLVPVVEWVGSPITTAPPKVLIPEADKTTMQPTISPSPVLFPLPIFTDATDGSRSVSAKVTFGIVFALSLFIAVNLALFCLWHKRCRGSRELPPTSRPSRSRVSSSQTLVGGSSLKGPGASGQ